MLHCNGMVVLIGREDVAQRARHALCTLRHRAWHGYVIQTEDGVERSHDGGVPNGARWVLASCAHDEEVKLGPLLHGAIYGSKQEETERMVEHAVQKEESEQLEQTLARLDGDYAIAHIEHDVLTYARGALGVVPLYVAKDSQTLGLASEVKALKSAGFNKVDAVLPGFIYREGFEMKENLRFISPLPQYATPSASDEAPSKVLSLLKESVRRRVEGRRVAVGFSGGLDSSLLAHLASEFTDVHLVSVHCPGSRDETEAGEAAEFLGLPLERILVSEKELKSTVESVAELVERIGAMDVSIGTAFHLAAKRVKELELQGLMLGQLADELFGGYSKYLEALVRGGDAEAWRMMAEDVMNAHSVNFERDEKAASPFTSLLLPYANLELVNYVIPLPASFKLNLEKGIRKKLLRRVAVEAGLPAELAQKPKKAVQYSSGIQKLIEGFLHPHLT